ncbi:MAG: amidophosphoribosyltransferase [Planctomycetota bacterium]
MTQPISLPQLLGSEAKDKCGVFGVWGHPRSAHLSYSGLYAQQHRGQESAGIAVVGGGGDSMGPIASTLGMGLVADVFDADELDRLEKLGPGSDPAAGGAIGHNRYSTAGGSLGCNVQPLVERFGGGQVAVAHNGNLVNAEALRSYFTDRGHLFHTTSDTEVMIHLLASPEQRDATDPLAATLRRLQGAFSVVFLFEDRIEAARDPWGWRPLVLGEVTEHGASYPVVASETVALDVTGARFVREVEPGEIVRLTAAGVESRRFADPADRLAHCVFEHVYFASPASNVFGQNVQTARERMGEALAAEAPAAADFVMPMPDSGRSAANGYARASGLPYREGIVPNRYVGRSFIKPTQAEREAAVRLKLQVVREIVEGQRVVVVDDSIVRGTTTRVKMRQIREAGAEEIHLRISCPPIRHPCYFGVDFAKRDELVATGRDTEAIRAFLEVDSLHFLSRDGMLACVERDNHAYCTACFDGDYRLDVSHPTTGEVSGLGQERMF